MKRLFRVSYFLFFIVLACMLGPSPIAAQAMLKHYHCTALQATVLPANTSRIANSESYRFILEKQVVRGLWQKVQVQETAQQEVLFTQLSSGAYRVIIIPPTLLPNATELMYPHLIAEGITEINSTSTIKSNTAILSKNDCEKTPKKTVAHPRTIAPDQLHIYPNPATDQLHVAGNTPITQLSLYTLMGKLLLMRYPQNNPIRIDLSNIRPGVYLLALTDSTGHLETRRVSIVR